MTRIPATAVAFVAVVLLGTAALGQSVPCPPPGTVLVTRNDDTVGNPSLGHWNHAAIVGPNGWVVESQKGLGVIAVPWRNFYARYPEIMGFLLLPPDRGAALAAAAVAQLRQPHRPIIGNCVDIVQDALKTVVERRPIGQTPTSLVRARFGRPIPDPSDGGIVFWKNDPAWRPPAVWFAGRTNRADIVLSRQASTVMPPGNYGGFGR